MVLFVLLDRFLSDSLLLISTSFMFDNKTSVRFLAVERLSSSLCLILVTFSEIDFLGDLSIETDLFVSLCWKQATISENYDFVDEPIQFFGSID